MAKGDGKTLEALVGKSVDQFGFNRSTGSLQPLCDRVQALRTQGGRMLLWECKEVGTRGSAARDHFCLTDMTQNERDVMRLATADGALCVIVFMHQVDRINRAFWATTWPEWKAHEDLIGFIENRDHFCVTGTTVKRRRKPGTTQVSLVGPGRPSCLRPIPYTNGRLDFVSFLEGCR